MKPVIGIGWDVGGWQGDKHGWAACRWAPGESLTWFDGAATRRIHEGGLFELQDILLDLTGSDLAERKGERVIIAIDAPLGFPSGFRKLLTGETSAFVRPDRQINSRLAYRHTDRHVFISSGGEPTPLSAPFDRLGNNATVAMVHARHWEEQYGFSVPPLTKVSDPDRVAIEVYPALAKDRSNGNLVRPEIARFLPTGLDRDTHDYDAAICALHAVTFGAGDKMEGLPPLIPPDFDCEEVKEEGWIYHFAPGKR